jgi:lathosterol oxidase
MSWPSVIWMTLALTLIIAVRYLAVAGAVHALVWVAPHDAASRRRLNRDAPNAKLIWQEIRLSLMSSWIYALPAALAYEAWRMGWTRVYLNVDQYGWPWLIVSGLIYLAVQDTYYYWIHRAMHHSAFFRWTHAAHHRSRQPSPFASFAFSALEAAATAWVLPALVFVVPIHPAVILTLLTVMTAAAVLNHAGWELMPGWLVRGPVGDWLITATHHSRHHTHMTTNYGLYFRLWDRLMGTDAMPEAPARLAPVAAE